MTTHVPEAGPPLLPRRTQEHGAAPRSHSSAWKRSMQWAYQKRHQSCASAPHGWANRTERCWRAQVCTYIDIGTAAVMARSSRSAPPVGISTQHREPLWNWTLLFHSQWWCVDGSSGWFSSGWGLLQEWHHIQLSQGYYSALSPSWKRNRRLKG